jgi:hypothetical protein
MRALLLCFVVLVSVALCGASSPYSVCYMGDEDCPPCPANASININALIWLSPDIHFVEETSPLEDYIKSTDPKNLIQLDSLLALHTTLEYICCHTKEEIDTIHTVAAAYQWKHIDIAYESATCNVDHNNSTVYIAQRPNNASQAALLSLVRGLESAYRAAGIRVNHPRSQEFHSTLARVTHEYPTNKVCCARLCRPLSLTLLSFVHFFFRLSTI